MPTVELLSRNFARVASRLVVVGEQHRSSRIVVGDPGGPGCRAGPAVRRRFLTAADGSWLPGTRRLQRGRDHLPAARLLGAYRTGGARGAERIGFWLPAS